MCRFVAYFSNQSLVLDTLLSKPDNSLIKQSHQALEGAHGINADGFGVAWYNFALDSTPGIFKSIQPAWNDNNLMHLAQKISSPCFLAHVRSSTIGDVTQHNCHPFAFQDYAFVHNGTIRNFDHYKKSLINELEDQLFLNIKGNTDSEYFFFLIMHFLQQDNCIQKAVQKATSWVVQQQNNAPEFSRLNIVITNGQEMLATRFVSKGEKPLSLYYSLEKKHQTTALILSSESLDQNKQWLEAPENHYLYINKDNMELIIKKILIK